jgi:predicted alpha/beta-hydrolase family hydrolase
LPASARNRTTRGELDIHDQRVSWVRDGVLRGRPVYILAHGAGAPYTSRFMQAVAQGLVQRGVCVVRFHFPYMERAQRDRRRYPPDRPALLVETCRAVIDLATAWLPRAKRSKPPIVVGGKSMGGRMMSMLLAADDAPLVAGAVYLGYPLHAPGRTDKLRKEHLQTIAVPQLFLSGTRDSLARLELLRPIVDALSGAELHVVEGGDHSLSIERKNPLAGSEKWLDAVGRFCSTVAAGA